jgi:hypothetical protein
MWHPWKSGVMPPQSKTPSSDGAKLVAPGLCLGRFIGILPFWPQAGRYARKTHLPALDIRMQGICCGLRQAALRRHGLRIQEYALKTFDRMPLL